MLVRGFNDKVEIVVYNTGLSKKKLAEMCGFDRKLLCRDGEGTNLSAINIKRFCQVTGASADWLLGLSDVPYRKKVEF